jgi:hypothetical protein
MLRNPYEKSGRREVRVSGEWLTPPGIGGEIANFAASIDDGLT